MHIKILTIYFNTTQPCHTTSFKLDFVEVLLFSVILNCTKPSAKYIKTDMN